MKTVIIVPTYDEAANIGKLLDAIFRVTASIHSSTVDVLIVDDNSPDGTGSIVVAFSMERGLDKRLFLLTRTGKLGLASAYTAGLSWGLEHGYEQVIIMDADLSHNPSYLPEMIGKMKESDLVIGSRYVQGGGVLGWGIMRKIVSFGGSFFARSVLRCPIKDFTSGFTGWKSEALEKLNMRNISSKGYSFNFEIKYRAFRAGLKIAEFPILFENRVQGKSKMPLSTVLEAVYRVFILRRIVK